MSIKPTHTGIVVGKNGHRSIQKLHRSAKHWVSDWGTRFILDTGVNYKCGGTLLLQTIRPIKKVMPVLFSRRAS